MFWTVCCHFSAISASKIAKITKFMYFSDKPNVELEPTQNCEEWCECEVPHDSPKSRCSAPSEPYSGEKYKNHKSARPSADYIR